MEQYILKSALITEIERQILAIDNTPKITDTQISVLSGNKVTLTKLLSLLDTLEVKEVGLEKENLTWKDIRELYIIFAEIDAEIEFCKTDIQGETIGYYQEALKRLKAQKGE